MKTMKKLSALLLAFAMICTMLTGCGGAGGDGKTADGKIKLKLESTYSNKGTIYVDKLVDGFNKSQDKYFLEVASGSDPRALRTKMQMSKQDKYPSMICGASTAMVSYAEADYVKPLQDFIDKDSEDWTKGVFDAVRSCYSDQDGRLIGWPTGVSCNGYVVNEDILKKLGYTVDDLTSFETIAKIAKEAKDKGLCKYGISFNNGVDLLDMMVMQGADIVDQENGYAGTPTKAIITEGDTNKALTKAATIMSDLYKNGVAHEYGPGTQAGTTFKANDLLFWKCTNSSMHELFESATAINWSFIPSVGIDESAKFKGGALSEGTGIFICNTGDEEEMQGAYEFIKYISQPENQYIFTTGIGYIPYTEAATEKYLEWAKENFPSAEKMINMLKASPAELVLPYTEAGTDITDAFGNDIIGAISQEPDGDIATCIQTASDAINQGLDMIAKRKQK